VDFWNLSIVQYSRNYKIKRFGNWICFCPPVMGEVADPVSETFCFLLSRIPDDGQIPKTQ
jgi:hypothetical protein